MSRRPLRAPLAALCLGLAFPLAVFAATPPATTLALSYGSDPAALSSVTGSNYASLGLLQPGTEYFQGVLSGGSSASGQNYFSDSFTFSLGASASFSAGANGSSDVINFFTGSRVSTAQPLTLSLYQGSTLIGSSFNGPLSAPVDFSHGDSFTLAVGGAVPNGSNGFNYYGHFSVAAVPEPSSAALMLVGGVLLGAMVRRRRRS